MSSEHSEDPDISDEMNRLHKRQKTLQHELDVLQHNVQELRFQAGDDVIFHGLGVDYAVNGYTGIIQTNCKATSKYVVRYNPPYVGICCLDASNMMRIDHSQQLQHGNSVMVHSMTHNFEYNGKFGNILGFNEEAGRFVIELANGDSAQILPNNLVSSSEPSTEASRVDIEVRS
jgi:hypothetical protein